ncbi:MAG: hypothetical protein IKX51_00165 [Bacteroidales bacterium]|nr:hypothetical protein [Bacteroidales bacterium]
MSSLLKRLSENKYMVLGHCSMLVLFILAVVFANERVLLTDSAYQVFYDINHDGVLINDSRYTMVLTQILPWLAVHLHAPLHWIIVAYSVSFVLVGYGCFLLTAYAMKDRLSAVLMLFVFLAIGGTFLHCISESFQLMFYVPMFYAWLAQGSEGHRMGKLGYYLLLALLEAIAFFIYPVAAFYILFAIGFQMLEGGRPHIDKPAFAAIAFLAVFCLIYFLMGMSGHDSEFVPTGDLVRNSLQHFFSLGSFMTFVMLFPRYYLAPTLLLIITLIGYGRSRQWWKLTFVAGYALFYFVSAVIIYQTGDSRISRERYFIPLFFIIGLAFLKDELPRWSAKKDMCFYFIFIALICFSFGRIIHYVHRYQPRMEAIAKVSRAAKAEGQHKIIVTQSTAEEVFPLDIWGLALESMLLTAQDGPEHTVTIFKEEDDFDRADSNLYHNPDVFVSVGWWKEWYVKDLNPRYFSLPPQGYKELQVQENNYVFTDF